MARVIEFQDNARIRGEKNRRLRAELEEADKRARLEEKRKFGSFSFDEVDCREVRRACMSLNNTSSLGTDRIPT
ncbi:MAG: hypothetical protein ACPIOQ_73690, partial [Promethearchaeia archaeon]